MGKWSLWSQCGVWGAKATGTGGLWARSVEEEGLSSSVWLSDGALAKADEGPSGCGLGELPGLA